MAILCPLIAGCARLEVRHVQDGDTSKGIHFHEPTPYLLVSATPKTDGGNVTTAYSTQIVYLPNKRQRYVAQIKPGWGTVDGSVKLVNGWMLESVGAKMDSKGPETIAAIAGLIKESAALAGMNEDERREAIVGLYRIDIALDGSVAFTKTGRWVE